MEQDWNKIINLLEPHMYAPPQAAAQPTPPPPPPPPPPLEPRPPSQIKKPQEKDTLFWCCYMIMNRPSAYEFLISGRGDGNARKIEMETKMSFVEKMRENPAKIKSCNHKVTKVAAQEIASNLGAGQKMGVAELIAFCVYMEYRVRLIFCAPGGEECKGLMYMDIIPDVYKEEHTILVGTVFYYLWVDSAAAPPEPPIHIEQYTKPIRGASTYKTDELHKMYDLLCGGRA
jgi:hypothetical protein